MNPRTFGSSIWLLAVVAVMVLFIGAFTRFDTTHGQSNPEAAISPAATPTEVAVSAPPQESLVATQPAVAPKVPTDLSPGLAEIIKLAQSHIPEETILAFVQNSGQTYKPTADEILYLYDLGVSDKVVSALFKKPETAVAAPATPAPPVDSAPVEIPPAAIQPAANLASVPDPLMNPPSAPLEDPPPLENPKESYFFDSLSPYGSWVQLDDGSWAWQPMVSSVSPDWVPYRDRGHWLLTDDGWYWSSDYSWGWAAFHYGRWSQESRFGWVWHPGSVWAPAWVAWRNSDDYSGWAPLPPGVLFQPDLGLMAGPGLAGFNVSFGISPTWFTFVSYNNFQSRRVAAFAAPASRATALFKSATPVNSHSMAGHKVLNLGVAPERIAAATKATVNKYNLQEASSPDTAVAKPRDRSLAVFRPDISTSKPLSAAPINKTALTAYSDNSMARAFAPKNTAATEGNSDEAARPASSGNPARPGFNYGNFRPSARPNPALVGGPPGAGGVDSPTGEFRRNPAPAEARPGYPMAGPAAYSSRAYSAPSAAPPYVAPQAAPVASHGGGTPAASASTSTSSSSSSKSGNKN